MKRSKRVEVRFIVSWTSGLTSALRSMGLRTTRKQPSGPPRSPAPARGSPSTSSFTLPLGSLRCWTMVATVPTELISSGTGCPPWRCAGGQEQALVLGQRPLHRQQGGLPPHHEGDHGVREHHDVPQRDHGEVQDAVSGTRGAFFHRYSYEQRGKDRRPGEARCLARLFHDHERVALLVDTSRVTTTSLTPVCEGSMNIMSSISSSRIMRKPRAPILRSMASWPPPPGRPR